MKSKSVLIFNTEKSMNPCHANEHIICFQYNEKEPTIQFVALSEEKNFEILSGANHIVFVHSGSVNVSCQELSDKKMKSGESILIPIQNAATFTALRKTTLLVMKLDFETITACDAFPLKLLLKRYEKTHREDDNVRILKYNRNLKTFCNTLADYVNDGIKCSYFYDLKIREFLYLIRVYYDKSTVFHFFKPVYNADFIFSNNVYQNIDKVKTIKELASTLDYSMSGLEKRFNKVFNLSPHQWLQQQKAKKIYHEINCSKRTFSEIAFDFGFSSPAHFNDFCRIYFNNTPGGVRKESEKLSMALFK